MQLERLDLSNNQLRAIPPAIKQLVNLEDLLLANNQIQELPTELCALRSLQSLSLQHNLFDHTSRPFDGDISALSDLISLDLSFNNFGEVPTSICSLSSLQELNMSNNRISYIREELPLGDLQNLLILDLSHNSIVKFGTVASRFVFEIRFTSANLILYRNICSLIELVVLELSHNRLIMLPLDLWKLNVLRSVKVGGNPALATEFGLSNEVIESGTKAILGHLKATQLLGGDLGGNVFQLLSVVSC